jgi:hypothetical protein
MTVSEDAGRRPAWRHRTIDLRTDWAIDILIADLDGDGLDEILSGSRWYRGPGWQPLDIPNVAQVIAVMDVDDDGALEVIATRGPDLTSRLCWAKRIGDGWVTFDIGEGGGDWPHGAAVLLDHPPGSRALITSYHGRGLHPPEVWTVPPDPTQPWGRSTLCDIHYSEEMVVVDLDGDGRTEIVAGPWWLEDIDGVWTAHRFADPSYDNVARVRVADLDQDGRLEIVLTEETGDWATRDPGLGRITRFIPPADIRSGTWTEDVIARKKCPHSLDIADIDGDGRLEVLVGEHDAFTPNGQPVNAGLFIHRSSGGPKPTWSEETVDSRFEHFDGAQAIRLPSGCGIVSHGWTEPRYLHLWEPTSLEERHG